MRESFMRKFSRKKKERKHICVGLDTDLANISRRIEAFLREEFCLPTNGCSGPLAFRFNQQIIDATKDLVACYKLNRAFYEGYNGLWALQSTAKYLREVAPDVPWFFDAKYGDVGNTAQKYAHYAFDILKADAVTVNPYGGRADGIDAFLKYKDKGIFVWCCSSNEGADEFQGMDIMGWIGDQERGRPALSYLYIEVAKHASKLWNKNGNCGVVVGATYPDELRIVREIVGDMPILIPGIGAQGGDLRESVKAAIYTDLKTGKKSLSALFNSSRGIIYASSGRDFAEAARRKTEELNNAIRSVLKDVL